MRYFMILLVVILCGCDETQSYYDPDSGSDSDSDSDSDTDTDGDIDTDCSEDGICDNPPDSFCSEDGTQFIEYTGEATCTAGECSYSTVVHDCTADEYDGDCVIDSIDNEVKCNDPCVNVTVDEYCGEGQWPFCLGDYTLRTLTDLYCDPDFEGNLHCFAEDTSDLYCPNGCVVIEDGPDYCQE